MSSDHTHVPRRLAPILPLLILAVAASAASAQSKKKIDVATYSDAIWALEDFRAIDGSGNNLTNPEWGSAGMPLQRLTPADYGDDEQTPAGADRPSARAVSNAVVAQAESIPIAVNVTDFVWQWGQFLDHDLDLTEGANPPEAFDILVPMGDPHFDPFFTGTAVIPLNRSVYLDPEVSPLREQVNLITSFIDASNVYGSDEERADELRHTGGRLKRGRRNLLPFNENGFPNAPSADIDTLFLAGDVRANEQVALTAMHTLFVREHNRIVKWLTRFGLDPDQRYDVARMLVGAELQAITFNEFLPVLLGPDALPAYAGYDPDVDPGISNLFSTVAYRFGHSMLSPELKRLKSSGKPIGAGHLPLQAAFFAPDEILRHGIDPVLRGLADQRPQEVDTHMVDGVRNFLFGPPGAGGFDLASLNIQRGRDHGACSYNEARGAKGLALVTTWSDISSDPDVQADLASVYDTVDQVDAWVGGLAEDHVPGALVGELVRTVLVDEFVRLRAGDRYWYQHHLPPELQAWVDARTLSVIIADNTRIKPQELQANVFLGPATE